MLCSKLQRLWSMRGGFRVIDLDHNYFLVKLADGDDYMRALTGGPWVVFDHYLTVEPWQPNFDPASHKVTSVVAWIRVPRLSTELYQLAILKKIGNRIGQFLRVDYSTQKTERGCFAKAAVELGLSHPLQTETCVDGVWYTIKYESLPNVCFECGRAGHDMSHCPSWLARAPTHSASMHMEESPAMEAQSQADVEEQSVEEEVVLLASRSGVAPMIRQGSGQGSGVHTVTRAGSGVAGVTKPGHQKMRTKGIFIRDDSVEVVGKDVHVQKRAKGSLGYTLSGVELAQAAVDATRKVNKVRKGKNKVGQVESSSSLPPPAPPNGDGKTLTSSGMAVAFDLLGQGHSDVAVANKPPEIAAGGSAAASIFVDVQDAQVDGDSTIQLDD
ncbi:hypothetical protein Tsubulata_030269 [Turnera subulata]|uniref:CCHC-type domain-containing protein n=1 Tax=Turnera subulata TaxID=218843 RepID=A0A9Q0J4H2_9ROSI|nr:hypothetical protein Tsubulata_030269 [Turnera subulata]